MYRSLNAAYKWRLTYSRYRHRLLLRILPLPTQVTVEDTAVTDTGYCWGYCRYRHRLLLDGTVSSTVTCVGNGSICRYRHRLLLRILPLPTQVTVEDTAVTDTGYCWGYCRYRHRLLLRILPLPTQLTVEDTAVANTGYCWGYCRCQHRLLLRILPLPTQVTIEDTAITNTGYYWGYCRYRQDIAVTWGENVHW